MTIQPLHVYQRRLQQAGRKDLRRRSRILLAPGNDVRVSCFLFWIKAFSETDLTEDLKKVDVPTVILHGGDDQIVPIGAPAKLSSKLVKNVILKVCATAPHGLCTTLKDQVNQDLLAFFKS